MGTTVYAPARRRQSPADPWAASVNLHGEMRPLRLTLAALSLADPRSFAAASLGHGITRRDFGDDVDAALIALAGATIGEKDGGGVLPLHEIRVFAVRCAAIKLRDAGLLDETLRAGEWTDLENFGDTWSTETLCALCAYGAEHLFAPSPITSFEPLDELRALMTRQARAARCYAKSRRYELEGHRALEVTL